MSQCLFPPRVEPAASCILRHALTHTDSHRHTHTELVPNQRNNTFPVAFTSIALNHTLIICAYVNTERCQMFLSELTCCHMVCVCGEKRGWGGLTPPNTSTNKIIFTSLQCHSNNRIPEQNMVGIESRSCTYCSCTDVLFPPLHTHTLVKSITHSGRYTNPPSCPTGPCYSELGALCPV